MSQNHQRVSAFKIMYLIGHYKKPNYVMIILLEYYRVYIFTDAYNSTMLQADCNTL